MITLDEAIEQEKFEARVDRINACNKSAEDHEQIADWLKELKELRTTSCCYNTEDIELNRNAMYNKAVDDFVKLAKEYDFKYGDKYITHCVIRFIEFLSEQLKERDVNDRNFN